MQHTDATPKQNDNDRANEAHGERLMRTSPAVVHETSRIQKAQTKNSGDRSTVPRRHCTTDGRRRCRIMFDVSQRYPPSTESAPSQEPASGMLFHRYTIDRPLVAQHCKKNNHYIMVWKTSHHRNKRHRDFARNIVTTHCFGR